MVVALVGFQVGDMLHATLDSLRNELRLLLRGGHIRECLSEALAIPVVAMMKRFRPLDSDRWIGTEAEPNFTVACGPFLPPFRGRGLWVIVPVVTILSPAAFMTGNWCQIRRLSGILTH